LKGEMEGELMSREEAEKIMDECMKVLFYRDARSLNKVSGRSLMFSAFVALGR
jgi:20S proteasome alpha/beta subunit